MTFTGYRWLLDGEEVMAGERVELGTENGDLRVGTPLGYSDAGNYTCVAETGAGTDTVSHTVIVAGERQAHRVQGSCLSLHT